MMSLRLTKKKENQMIKTAVDYKMITPMLELTFYKDQEEHLEKDWNDFLKRREDFTIYLVCERWEDPQTYGKIYYSLKSAKRAAGWLEDE